MRNPAKGRVTCFMLKWFGFFFWGGGEVMKMTAYNVACMQCRWLVAILSVVALPSRGQRSLPSCKELSLHSEMPLCFNLAGKGLFLKLLLGPNSSSELGSKIYFCMLAFFKSNGGG